MDEEKKLELLSQAGNIYNSALGGMPGLERWADSFEGTEEYSFVRGLYNFVHRKNILNVSTRVFGLDNIDFKEYLDGLLI